MTNIDENSPTKSECSEPEMTMAKEEIPKVELREIQNIPDLINNQTVEAQCKPSLWKNLYNGISNVFSSSVTFNQLDTPRSQFDNQEPKNAEEIENELCTLAAKSKLIDGSVVSKGIQGA